MDSSRYIRQPEVGYDSNIVVQEKFDVLLYNLHNGSIENLTAGNYRRKYRYIKDELSGNSIGMLFSWSTEFDELAGFSILVSRGKLKKLSQDHAKYSKFVHNNYKILYLKEKSNQPPALYEYDILAEKESLIYQSNKHDFEAANVRTVYHQWITDDGNKRSAVVRLPIGYNVKKKYPAIFDLYSERYPEQHVYKSPFKETGARLNYRRYISNDYLIVEPDITYEIGNPGLSTAEYLEDVYKEVIDKFNVQADKVGVFGHSFGGYETNFVISQSVIFKAAVSWSGVSDLTDFYFTFNPTLQNTNFFRFESQQWRMGKSFFDAPGAYYDNSPIHQAHKIQTPLLLITGKEDEIIDYRQTVKMFLALKRLSKVVDMVLYPGEGHQLFNHGNVIDAQSKVKSYFDYHLKNIAPPDWLK